tara:strand:+ start:50 stop:226 length:177 start_codon:yes stop_codon:yes gene_type:complete
LSHKLAGVADHNHRILIRSEGPKDNIVKIRSLLTIEEDDVAMIVVVLDEILGEALAII